MSCPGSLSSTPLSACAAGFVCVDTADKKIDFFFFLIFCVCVCEFASRQRAVLGLNFCSCSVFRYLSSEFHSRLPPLQTHCVLTCVAATKLQR